MAKHNHAIIESTVENGEKTVGTKARTKMYARCFF